MKHKGWSGPERTALNGQNYAQSCVQGEAEAGQILVSKPRCGKEGGLDGEWYIARGKNW